MWQRLLQSALGLRFLRAVDKQRRAGQLTHLSVGDLHRLAVRSSIDLSQWAPDYREKVKLLLAGSHDMASLAREIALTFPSIWDDLDRHQQVWVEGRKGGPPSMDRFDVDLDQFAGAPKPRQALWTCTLADSLVTDWIEWMRFGEDHRRGPYKCWRLVVDPGARVFEIRAAEDWLRLVGAYGIQRSDGQIMPDWRLVARDWEAVHLSLGGLLSAERVVMPIGASSTALEGWNMESTVWFRWAFTTIEAATTVP
jgi:hypothetical protein